MNIIVIGCGKVGVTLADMVVKEGHNVVMVDTDAEKLASAGYLAGYLTDVAASALFVLGFKMDVRGAILATVLGKAVGVCVFLFHFTRKWARQRREFQSL